MRILFAITLILATLPSLSWSETINIDDLVIRDSLYFKKFTDVPFTGEAKITEETNPFRAVRGDGYFANGKKDGFWKFYSKNGGLDFEGMYQKGVENGLWKFYHKNGQLSARIEQKNGWYDGLAEYFNEDDSLSKTVT